MSFGGFVARHTRSIVLIMVALTFAGVIAAFSMPIGLFPETAFPRILVNLGAGSRPASQTALLVTRPAEMAVRSVPGVLGVRSSTTRGSAQLAINFDWGTDMIASTLQVESAIAQILPSLPAGTTYSTSRMTPTVYPIISYALLSDHLSPVALQDLALYQIAPLLASIPGLARTDVQGGQTREIEVLADPHRLATYGIGMTELAQAVSAGNQLQAVGRLQDNHKLFLVVADRSLSAAAGIGDIVLRSNPTGIVRVRDVATVRDGVVPQWVEVSEDGQPAVLFNVYQQPSGNTVEIAAAVRAKLAAFKLPQGVSLKAWYDQSELVLQSAGSVRDAVLIGLALSGIVIFAFLRSWRAALIALLIVPATLSVTVLLLSLLGLSLNIMTLGGIAAVVGLLIDDVITMVEHLARRAGARGEDGRAAGIDAVLPATREFIKPQTGSSLATVIVFVPLSLLTGVTGAFSKALSVTMAVSLVVSYLMTILLVPVVMRRLVNFDRWTDPGVAGKTWLDRRHGWLLDRLISRPALLAIALVPLLALGVIAYRQVPTGFLPQVDQGGFAMDYYAKPGTSLAETNREAAEIDAWLHANPQVETFSRRLGTTLGNDITEAYHGDYFVRMKPKHTLSTPDMITAALAWVDDNVPGLVVEASQLMEDRIGDLTSVPQPIEIKLYGADQAVLMPVAAKVAAKIGKVPGVLEVRSGIVLAGDSLDLKIDPLRAAVEGLTPGDVTQAVDTALTGTVATELPLATKTVGVRVRLDGSRRLRQTELAKLPIRAPDGHVVPLDRVASIHSVTGEPQISRDNLQPMIAVTGRIEGRGVSAAIADITRELDAPGMLGAGIRYELGGLYQQQQIAFIGLAKVFVAALIAEFILLLFLYERFWLPAIIITCSLFSTVAVFTGLWLSGIALNITALMGMTMVIGIGTEMAIFYVSEYIELEHQMPARQALREASRNRLRPITMTTLAAILTLLPLALALGAGSGIQQPLAIAIVAGLLLQYPLVLLAMPVMIGLTTKSPSKMGKYAGSPT